MLPEDIREEERNDRRLQVLVFSVDSSTLCECVCGGGGEGVERQERERERERKRERECTPVQNNHKNNFRGGTCLHVHICVYSSPATLSSTI